MLLILLTADAAEVFFVNNFRTLPFIDFILAFDNFFVVVVVVIFIVIAPYADASFLLLLL